MIVTGHNLYRVLADGPICRAEELPRKRPRSRSVIQFVDFFGTGRPTHFVDGSHEWVQRDADTCVCVVCGQERPMSRLSGGSRCRASLSPVSWLPAKLQPKGDAA